MKILYHHRTRAEDAQGVHIDALCTAFRELGHEVWLFGPARAPTAKSSKSTARRSATTLFGMRVPSWLYEILALAYNVPAFFMLCAAIVRYRPHMVYERYALYNVAGRAAAAAFRLPFVLEVNAPLSLEMRKHGQLSFPRLAERAEGWLVARATRTVVVSGEMRRIFLERGAPAERLLVVPNGVDRRIFRTGIDGSVLRERLGLADRFVIGFVGWIRPWHGGGQLLDAFHRISDRLPKASLLFVGDGPAVPDLRAQATRLGIADRVIFTGAVDRREVPTYVAAMDMAVQPDVTDYASPIKLFEYLALAKPVVAPAKPNITEIVTDQQTALLFSPGDVEGLARQLVRLGEDANLRQSLSEAAERLVVERGFYWESNARRVVEAIAA